MAFLAVVLAGVAVWLGRMARREDASTVAKGLALAVGSLAILIAGGVLAFVGWGIVEELTRGTG